MSLDAYKTLEDKKNNKITKAIDCTAKDVNHVFYCLNPKCNAHLTLCSINSNKTISYFANKDKTHPHIPNCEYANSHNAYLNIFDHTSFEPNSFLKAIIASMTTNNRHTNPKSKNQHNNLKTSSVPISTVRQLYNICLSNPLNSKIGSTEIEYLLCNEATNFLYKSFISGTKLLIGKYNGTNNDTIFIKYPSSWDDLDNKFLICLHIENKLLLKNIKNLIKDYKNNILIFADFHTSSNNGVNYKIVHASISNIKQIIPLK